MRSALNLDGVYRGRRTSTARAFFNPQRIEVLKRPQGTLDGRHATANRRPPPDVPPRPCDAPLALTF